MPAPVFVDTNVLVYAIDLAAGDRHVAARRWMEALWSRQAGRLSDAVAETPAVLYIHVYHPTEPYANRAQPYVP